jgi:acyl carrier protein
MITTENVEHDASFEAVLAELTEILLDVIGDDFLVDVQVTAATTFNEDLALESIEFVALAEKLQERYAGRVDFPTFLAGLDIDDIMALTVGQLVGYIADCLTGVSPGIAAGAEGR